MIDSILEVSFEPELEDLVQAHLFLTRSTGNVLIRRGIIEAYFDTAEDRDAAAATLRELGASVSHEERPRLDWLQLYQQSLQPLFVGYSFVIAPDAALIPANTGRHALVIPQEQAFGTGSHETTALCIELLEEIDLRGKRVLDVGSGSGILALAMLRLGARKAIAFDHDLDTFGPLRENRARNHADTLSLFIGTIDAVGDTIFDVAMINIVPEVIIQILPIVKCRVRGFVVLSGILAASRNDVVTAAGLRLVSEKEKGEWWAGTFSV